VAIIHTTFTLHRSDCEELRRPSQTAGRCPCDPHNIYVGARFAVPPAADLRERILLARRAAWKVARSLQRQIEADV
jgi:hypothetical protein